jgi:tetratricopeptide (TPR) repeat protein
LLLALSSLAAAEEQDLELAKAHFATGQIYYERGRYPDAAREFEEAYRLSGKPELLYNMGKSYDGVGDHARALAAYRRWLVAVPMSQDRPEVEGRVKSLARLVARLTIKTEAGAMITIDGTRAGEAPLFSAVEINPGGHHIDVAKEGFRTFRHDLVSEPDKDITVQATLESLTKIVRVEVERKEKPVPVYKKWWLWTIVGVVVAGAAVAGGVLGSQQPPVSGAYAQLPVIK